MWHLNAPIFWRATPSEVTVDGGESVPAAWRREPVTASLSDVEVIGTAWPVTMRPCRLAGDIPGMIES